MAIRNKNHQRFLAQSNDATSLHNYLQSVQVNSSGQKERPPKVGFNNNNANQGDATSTTALNTSSSRTQNQSE